MPIDDELENSESIQAIAELAQKSAQEIVVRSQIVGLIAWFLPPFLLPVVAAAAEALNQSATKRLHARLLDMRKGFIDRLEEVGSSKVNKDWFQSEEFQTMLFEAAQQATVTSDRRKIAMLGNALANGGVTDFSEENRKELFLHLIRDLTPYHIAILRRLSPSDESSAWEALSLIRNPKEEDLLVLQMLTASGLVIESLDPPKVHEPRFGGSIPSANEARHIVARFIRDLQKPPRREFRLSTLGHDFLKFVSLSRVPDHTPTSAGSGH